MTRRFQFSVRALLWATGLICICLGVRQIYIVHFAEVIAAESAKVGQPIRLTGRFSLKDGPGYERFYIAVCAAGATSVTESTECHAERGRFGLYRFSEAATYLDQPRWTKPGNMIYMCS